jgi:hypothetical protein
MMLLLTRGRDTSFSTDFFCRAAVARSGRSPGDKVVADVLHASDAGASPQASSNIRHLSRTELPGGGQIVIQGHHAYVGHQNGPEGTTILDCPTRANRRSSAG